MIYNFWIKFFVSMGIVATLVFEPISVQYQDRAVIIQGLLTKPVTQEIQQLVKNHFVFQLEYYASIIVNNQEVYSQTCIRKLSYQNGGYKIDSETVDEKLLQEKMGAFIIKFPPVLLQKDDTVLVFMKVSILDDPTFRMAARLPVSVLWDYQVPKYKRTYVFDGEKLVLK